MSGTGTSNFQAVSLRPGEVHWADIRSQVGNAQEFEVRAIDDGGHLVVLYLQTAQKWGHGWQTVLECPLCGVPARVLTLVADSAACGRCVRRPALQSGRKNCVDWRFGGGATDMLIRAVVTGKTLNRRQRQVQANRTIRQSLAWADKVWCAASAIISSADTILRNDND